MPAGGPSRGDGSSEHAGEETGCRCHAGTFPPGPDAAKGRPQGEHDKEGADQDTQPEFRKHPEDVDSRHGPRQRCRQHGQKRFPEAGAQMHQGHAGIDKEVQDAADQDDLAQGQEKWCRGDSEDGPAKAADSRDESGNTPDDEQCRFRNAHGTSSGPGVPKAASKTSQLIYLIPPAP